MTFNLKISSSDAVNKVPPALARSPRAIEVSVIRKVESFEKLNTHAIMIGNNSTLASLKYRLEALFLSSIEQVITDIIDFLKNKDIVKPDLKNNKKKSYTVTFLSAPTKNMKYDKEDKLDLEKSKVLFVQLKNHLDSRPEFTTQAFEKALKNWIHLRAQEASQSGNSIFKSQNLEQDLGIDRYVKSYDDTLKFFSNPNNFFPRLNCNIEEHLGINLKSLKIKCKENLLNSFIELKSQVVAKCLTLDDKTMIVSDEVVNTVENLGTFIDSSPGICSSSSLGTVSRYLKGSVFEKSFPLTLVMRFLHAQKEEQEQFANILIQSFPKDIIESNSLYLEITAIGSPLLWGVNFCACAQKFQKNIPV